MWWPGLKAAGQPKLSLVRPSSRKPPQGFLWPTAWASHFWSPKLQLGWLNVFLWTLFGLTHLPYPNQCHHFFPWFHPQPCSWRVGYKTEKQLAQRSAGMRQDRTGPVLCHVWLPSAAQHLCSPVMSAAVQRLSQLQFSVYLIWTHQSASSDVQGFENP